MQEPTVLQVKDIQDAVAKSLHLIISDEEDVLQINGGTHYLVGGGNEPSVGELLSNQFELLLEGEDEVDPNVDPDEYDMYEDVLVVTVAWQRRRKR